MTNKPVKIDEVAQAEEEAEMACRLANNIGTRMSHEVMTNIYEEASQTELDPPHILLHLWIELNAQMFKTYTKGELHTILDKSLMMFKDDLQGDFEHMGAEQRVH